MRRFWKTSLMILSFPIAAHLWFRIDNATTVSQLERAARAKQSPLTLSDLSKEYSPIPDDQNAAIPLLEIWRRDNPNYWKAFENGSSALPEMKPDPEIFKQTPGFGINSNALLENRPLLEEVKVHVAAMQSRREAVRQALKRGNARFVIQFEDGLDALLPHLKCIVREATEFHLEAMVAIAEDRPADAVRSIESIAAIGNLMRDEAFVIGQFFRIKSLMLAATDISRFLSRHQPTAATLNQLEAVIQSMDASETFPRMLMSEQAVALSAFSNPARYYVHDSKSGRERRLNKTAMRAFGFLGINDADRRLILETFAKLDRYSALTSHQDIEQIRKILVGAARETASFPPKIVSNNSLPSLDGIAQRCARMKALQSTALTAIAIERYRLQNKRLPALLEDLQPRFMAEVPTDLFTGKPLQFEVLDAGYLVYSLGPDRKDDDGTPSVGLDPSRSLDVVFGVRR